MKTTSSSKHSIVVVAGVVFFVLIVIYAALKVSENRTSTVLGSDSSPTVTRATRPTFTPTPNLTLTAIATYQPSPDPVFSFNIQVFNGVERVYVPAGYFIMGDQYDDNLGFSDEIPHPVYTNAFWLDAFLVTNEEFARCSDCGVPEDVKSHKRDPYFGSPAYANYPVIEVSWQQAHDFCEWRGGRLPTEAEWEKAAGWDPVTGRSRLYPWGARPPNDTLANFNGVDRDTTPVDRYRNGRSPVGAFDMAGNVWQWVADWYGDYDLNNPRNPTGVEDGTVRVMRGGSWHTGVLDAQEILLYLRVSNRGSGDPNRPLNETGFRCAYDADED